MTGESTKCGLIALVGRPNVGKSTLLNFILQQKLSITSRKPQTTRQQVLGVKTSGHHQMIFVDTPGLHRNEPKAINRAMNRSATSAMSDVDIVLFLTDRARFTPEDECTGSDLTPSRAEVAAPPLLTSKCVRSGPRLTTLSLHSLSPTAEVAEPPLPLGECGGVRFLAGLSLWSFPPFLLYNFPLSIL